MELVTLERLRAAYERAMSLDPDPCMAVGVVAATFSLPREAVADYFNVREVQPEPSG